MIGDMAVISSMPMHQKLSALLTTTHNTCSADAQVQQSYTRFWQEPHSDRRHGSHLISLRVQGLRLNPELQQDRASQ